MSKKRDDPKKSGKPPKRPKPPKTPDQTDGARDGDGDGEALAVLPQAVANEIAPAEVMEQLRATGPGGIGHHGSYLLPQCIRWI